MGATEHLLGDKGTEIKCVEADKCELWTPWTSYVNMLPPNTVLICEYPLGMYLVVKLSLWQWKRNGVRIICPDEDTVLSPKDAAKLEIEGEGEEEEDENARTYTRFYILL